MLENTPFFFSLSHPASSSPSPSCAIIHAFPVLSFPLFHSRHASIHPFIHTCIHSASLRILGLFLYVFLGLCVCVVEMRHQHQRGTLVRTSGRGRVSSRGFFFQWIFFFVWSYRREGRGGGEGVFFGVGRYMCVVCAMWYVLCGVGVDHGYGYRVYCV